MGAESSYENDATFIGEPDEISCKAAMKHRTSGDSRGSRKASVRSNALKRRSH